MKRIFTILFIFSIQVLVVSAQECYRFTYLQLLKRDSSENNFFSNEMCLDFDGKSSFYYSEVSFKKDSLNVIAFDKKGDIVNDEAYGERSRLPGSAREDKSYIDFSKGLMTQLYHDVAYFDGSMSLELPQWIITGDEEEQSGYLCKVAKGNYLGREWTVWYTEEIPVNVGPWFLWGLPGLIVYAKESENVLNFRLLGIEKIDNSRLSEDLSYLQNRKSSSFAKVYSMSMKDMEIMHTKYRRDVTYFNKIHGISDQYTEDRNGNRISESMTKPYIPYIPDEYWKGK